jgi:hypothetical protein
MGSERNMHPDPIVLFPECGVTPLGLVFASAAAGTERGGPAHGGECGLPHHPQRSHHPLVFVFQNMLIIHLI